MPEQNKEALVIGQRPRAPSAGDKPHVPQVLLRHSFGGNPDALPIADHAAILGKDTQTYTINGSHIYNKEGKEVFKADAPNAGSDRLAIFANLAVQQGRAVRVTHRGNEYVVNNKGQIISIASKKLMKWEANNGDRIAILADADLHFGNAVKVEYKNHSYIVFRNSSAFNDDDIFSVTTEKIMKWGDENGDRKAILEAAKNAFAAKKQATQNPNAFAAKKQATQNPQEGTITSQLISHLQNIGIPVHTKEEAIKYLKEHGYDDITQSIIPYGKNRPYLNKSIKSDIKKKILSAIRGRNYNNSGTDVVNLDGRIYLFDHESSEELEKDLNDKNFRGDGFGVRSTYNVNNITKNNVREIIRNIAKGYNYDKKRIYTVLQTLGIKQGYLSELNIDAELQIAISTDNGLYGKDSGKTSTNTTGNRRNNNGSAQGTGGEGKIGQSRQINDIQTFTTPSGEIYGFVTKDGGIYLDETVISPEHPIHEYTHLWDAAVQRSNPELWKKGVQLMQRGASSLWNSIANDENYGKRWSANGIEGEELINLIASEVHSRLVGQKGAEFLDQMAKEKGKEGIISKLKDWILEFWKNLKATFSTWSKEDIDKLTLSDFNKMTVRDFAEGINPNTINPIKELLSSKQTTTDMTLSLPNFEHFVYDRTYDKLEGIKVDSSWKQQYLEKLDSHNNSRVA